MASTLEVTDSIAPTEFLKGRSATVSTRCCHSVKSVTYVPQVEKTHAPPRARSTAARQGCPPRSGGEVGKASHPQTPSGARCCKQQQDFLVNHNFRRNAGHRLRI